MSNECDWIRHNCRGVPGTVGGLIPNLFESVIRIKAPEQMAVLWWDSYKSLFESVIGFLIRQTGSTEELQFALWEGHGFEATSAGGEPELSMSERRYYLFNGNQSSLNDFTYPGELTWKNPDLIWPKDHEWFVATDVEFWSIYIASRSEAIEQLGQQFKNRSEHVSYESSLVIEN